METPSSPSGALIARPTSRRTLVKGVAWSVPAVSLAAATPAFAVSPTAAPRLEGELTLGRNCSTGGDPGFTFLRVENTDDPGQGLFVFNVEPSEIASTSLTFYFPASVTYGSDIYTPPADWGFASTRAAWSDLTELAPVVNPSDLPAGTYRVFTVTLSGSAGWTNVPATEPYSRAPDVFWTSGNVDGRLCNVPVAIQIKVEREVTLRDGTVLDFERVGPI